MQLSKLDREFYKGAFWPLLLSNPFIGIFSALSGLMLVLWFFILFAIERYFFSKEGALINEHLFFVVLILPALVCDLLVTRKIHRRFVVRFLKKIRPPIPEALLHEAIEIFYKRTKGEHLKELEAHNLIYGNKNREPVVQRWLATMLHFNSGHIIKEYINARTAKL